LRAAEAGLQGSDAPRHLGAEATPPRHQRGDRWRDARHPDRLAQSGPERVMRSSRPCRRDAAGGSAGAKRK